MRVYPQRKTTGRGPLFSVRPDFFAGQSIISSPDFSVPCPHKEIGFVASKIRTRTPCVVATTCGLAPLPAGLSLTKRGVSGY